MITHNLKRVVEKSRSLLCLLSLALVSCSDKPDAIAPPATKLQAATPTPTLTTITVDGTFADWKQVLLNPLQVSVDGNGINGTGCYPSSGDRDCESFTPQRDISRFAWTYDDTNVYTYLDRPNSNATLTYSFIMDVNVNGIAETTDRVLQATWKTGSRTVGVKLFAYVPFAAAGDPLTCPNAGVCPSAANPHAEVGFADGYTMLGSTGTELWTPPAPVPACSGSAAGDECGGDGIGTRFEVLVPWAQLGVPARSPIFWHVAASTNTQFSQAKDNVGGPDGRVGAFGIYGVDFTADLNGSMRSPGSYDYCHTVTNTGQFTDSYNLSAISSLGASVTFLADVGGCVAGATLTDTNGDLLPDTGLLAGGVSRSIIVRLTVGSGLNGSNDRLVATARSTGRGTVVFDSVTDRTRIGLVTVQPDFNVSGTPGLVVNIGPHIVQNNQGASDTFTYGVTSEQGYSVSLYSNVANAPGALLATDTNGDGVWDSTPPTVVLAADGGTVSNWLRVTIPPAAPIGTVDSVTLSATSNATPTVTSTATDTLRVLSGLTLTNSYTAPNSQLIGPAGSSIFLRHSAINSLAVSNTVTLTQTGVAAGYTMKWWSDPNGDGNISDGVQITSLVLSPLGGTQSFVTEITVPASGTPTSSAARTTGTGVLGSTAFADDNVAVGSLQTYLDAAANQPSRYFQACSTIYAKGVGLTPLQLTNYQMAFSDPTPTVRQSNFLPTGTLGTGIGSYSLLTADLAGAWRVQILSGATQISNLQPVTVERSGVVVADAPAAAVSGQTLTVSARLTSSAVGATYTNSKVLFVVTDPLNVEVRRSTVSVDDVLPQGTAPTVYGSWPSMTYTTYGNYTVTATWLTSCDSVIGSSTALIPNVPPAPTLSAPADNAVLSTTTPTLTGTGVAGATINVYIDGALAGTATGATPFSYSALVGQGLHTWYATQTINGLTSPASATRSFSVDSIDPAAPVVVTPANGSQVNTTTPTYTGTAEPGSTVTVRVDGIVACTATATAGGAFSCAQATALSQGAHAVSATASDAAGNVSAVSNTNTFTIDSIAPAAPVVTAPANGSLLSTTTPTYSGTAEAGSTVQVFVDGAPVCSAVATGGVFSCNQPALSPLSQGAHTVNATSTDAFANTSALSATNTFTVDTVAPAAPVVSLPANLSIIATRTPTYSGTAEALSTVVVRVDGTQVCSTVATAGGTFSCAQPTALADGGHSVNARATDLAGNVSAVSNTNNFSVVIIGPNAPVVASPAHNSFTNNPRPLYSGTSDPSNTINVSVDGFVVCTTVATAGGAWSCLQPVALLGGVHTVNATATDSMMLVSAPSATNSFTVDLIAPATPTLSTPADGTSINTTTPTYTGFAEPGSIVQVFTDSGLACTTVATAGGTFTCVPSAPLTAGPHSSRVTATDAANNPSPPSNTNAFIIDLTPPAAPVLIAPANGSQVNTATPTFSGTAEPGSTVTVLVDNVVACTTIALGTGAFSCGGSPSGALGEGPHTVKAIATDAATNVSADSNTNTFTVDTIAPAPPVLLTPADDSVVSTTTPSFSGTAEPGSLVSVRVDSVEVCTATAALDGSFSCVPTTPIAQGAHVVVATATDPATNESLDSTSVDFTVDTVAPADPVMVSPAHLSLINTTTPTYRGTAEPGSTVEVYVDTVLTCTATAAPSGAFSCIQPLVPGLTQATHAVRAIATDTAGNRSQASNTNTFTVDSVAPAAPVVSAPVAGSVVTTTTPTYSGTAEPGSSVTVTVDGAVACVTTATAGGTFSCLQAPPLTDGAHSVYATATDAAGNTSPVSTTSPFFIDSTAPAAPVVLLPANGSTVATTTPTYSGTAEPGSTVSVLVDTVQVCTAIAAGDGSFSCAQTPALGQGAHSVTATATDAANNTSPVSVPNAFTVDTVAPAAPVITAPAHGSAVSTTTPEYTGTAEPGSTVTVLVDSLLACTATAAANGSFTCVQTSPLSEGPHTVNATATDAANLTSPVSATNGFSVDLTAPDTSIVTAPPAVSTSASATFTFSSTEVGSTFECRLDADAAGFTPCGTPTAYSGLAEGSHTLQVRSRDTAGNVDPTPASHTWAIELELDTSIVTGPAAVTNSTTAVFTFSSNKNPVTYECSVDGDAFTACDTPLTLTGLLDGNHTLRARAKTLAGVVDTSPALRGWRVDTLAPAAPTITSPVAGESVGFNPPTVTGTAEPASTVTVIIDGQVAGVVTADAAGNWSFTPSTGLGLGAHTVSATATDAAQNTSGSTPPVTFTIDPTALDTRIVSGPRGSTSSTSAAFVFESNLTGASFECNLDGAGFSTCSASSTFSSLSQGGHRLQVRAKLNGTVDPTPATRVWSVDTEVPDAPVITSPANNATVGTASPLVQGTAPAGTTVSVLIDGVVVGTAPVDSLGQWSFTLGTPLAPGAHTVAAVAVDGAGNTSASSTVITFTVDLGALETFIVSGPNPISRLSTAVFDLASNQAGVTYECSLDGAAFAPCDDPATFAALADGSHTVLVRAKDGSNAVDLTPARFTWRVDTVAPSSAVLTPANGSTQMTSKPTITGTAEAGAIVEIFIDGQLVGTTIASASGAWSFPLTTALADGAHTVNVVAIDAAGNRGTSGSNAFTVITAELMVPTITGPTNGGSLNDSTPTITGKAAPNSTVNVYVDGVLIGTVMAGADGSWSFTPTTPLGEGMHVISVRSTRGQQTQESAPTFVTIDTVAPDTFIISAPGPAETSASFGFGSNETGVTYECSLDGGPFVRCDAQTTYADVTAGAHTLAVRATDAAGNRDQTPATHTWASRRKQSLVGGGCSCSTVEPTGVLIALGLWAARRRRR